MENFPKLEVIPAASSVAQPLGFKTEKKKKKKKKG